MLVSSFPFLRSCFPCIDHFLSYSVRDYIEGNGLQHEIFNYTLASNHNSTYFALDRQSINGSQTYQLSMTAESGSFNVTPSTNGSYTQPSITFLNETRVRFTFLTNETLVPGLSAAALFRSDSGTTNNKALSSALVGLSNGSNSVGNDVSLTCSSSEAVEILTGRSQYSQVSFLVRHRFFLVAWFSDRAACCRRLAPNLPPGVGDF